jgi:hypothetical protein
MDRIRIQDGSNDIVSLQSQIDQITISYYSIEINSLQSQIDPITFTDYSNDIAILHILFPLLADECIDIQKFI